jgi:hypothetical protein
MTDASPTVSPSPSSLWKAFGIALGIALVLLVLVVLPAERNIDVTGFGRAIGLTVLSAPEEVPPAAAAPPPATGPAPVGAPREDQAVLDLPPGKGLEYKFQVRAGEKLQYAWKCSAGELFYDFHGEPKGAAKDVFESYASGMAPWAKGVVVMPFEGTHGWYWKNTGTTSIRVTLDTSGRYEVVGIR